MSVSVSVEDFARMAAEAAERYPGSRLVRNGVGNVAVIVGSRKAERSESYIGGYVAAYLDLMEGVVHPLDMEMGLDG